jgi:hypothetical protein
VNKKFLIILHPYKMTDFIWELMEINEFDKCCDVIVYDLSLFLYPNFSKKTADNSIIKENLVHINSIFKLIKNLKKLIATPENKEIYLINQIPKDSYKEALVHLLFFVLFKNIFSANIETFIGGIPLNIDNSSKKINPYDDLNVSGLVSLFKQLIKKSFLSIPFFLNKLIPSVTTHVFYAGKDWLALAQSRHGDKVAYIPGSSNNYSESILFSNNNSSSEKNTAVLLDAPSPKYLTDAVKLGRKMYLTVDDWYPKITSFFDNLEKATGVTVEIAGHPMSKFSDNEPLFGYRRVTYMQTNERVRESSFVITRSSTAISFAIIYNKPIIFIYSNQLMKDKFAMSNMFYKASILGTTPVNIENELIDFDQLLLINEEKRLSYKLRCLSSENINRANSKIIMEDIMCINLN